MSREGKSAGFCADGIQRPRTARSALRATQAIFRQRWFKPHEDERPLVTAPKVVVLSISASIRDPRMFGHDAIWRIPNKKASVSSLLILSPDHFYLGLTAILKVCERIAFSYLLENFIFRRTDSAVVETNSESHSAPNWRVAYQPFRQRASAMSALKRQSALCERST